MCLSRVLRSISAGTVLSGLLLLVASDRLSAADRVVEVTTAGTKLSGQVLAYNKQQCWLVSGDGRMHGVNVRRVDRFRDLGTRLDIDNAVKVRGDLQRELGRDYTVLSSGRYVVAASGETARAHLQTFDGIARTFTSYFSKRRIPLDNPRFPLVAIVFTDQRQFAEYASKDGVRARDGLAGYYLRTSNRVASYEPGRTAAILPPDRPRTAELPLPGGPAVFDLSGPVVEAHAECPSSLTIDCSVSAGVRETLIHEAIHQMAFNTGLHHRAGSDPKWVIEGLATLLEPDAMRINVTSNSPSKRVNAERLLWFRERLRPAWQSSTLADLVASDRLFQTRPLDAYALAWGLTFYLNETRPREYANFLSVLKNRDPLENYDSDQRVTDFRSAFGRDMSRLEISMLRYLDALPASGRR